MHPRRPTQADVARRAGVSRALVSLVVRGSGRVSEDSAAAVRAAIDELGYRPQITATHPAAGRADSLILISPRIADETIALLARSAPVCVIGREVSPPGVSWVRADERAGGDLVVAHLLSRGATSLAQLGPAETAYADVAARERREAFMRSAARRRLPARAIELTEAMTSKDIEELAEQLRADGVDGVAVHNDRLAIGLLTQLRRQQFVGVIGYDDIPAAGLPIIGLSSVDQQPLDLARQALEALEAEHPQRRLLAPRLVARST